MKTKIALLIALIFAAIAFPPRKSMSQAPATPAPIIVAPVQQMVTSPFTTTLSADQVTSVKASLMAALAAQGITLDQTHPITQVNIQRKPDGSAFIRVMFAN